MAVAVVAAAQVLQAVQAVQAVTAVVVNSLFFGLSVDRVDQQVLLVQRVLVPEQLEQQGLQVQSVQRVLLALQDRASNRRLLPAMALSLCLLALPLYASKVGAVVAEVAARVTAMQVAVCQLSQALVVVVRPNSDPYLSLFRLVTLMQ